MKKRTYWCDCGCGKKVRLLINRNHSVIYICYECGMLFRKTSIGNTKPFTFVEVGKSDDDKRFKANAFKG